MTSTSTSSNVSIDGGTKSMDASARTSDADTTAFLLIIPTRSMSRVRGDDGL